MPKFIWKRPLSASVSRPANLIVLQISNTTQEWWLNDVGISICLYRRWSCKKLSSGDPMLAQQRQQVLQGIPLLELARMRSLWLRRW